MAFIVQSATAPITGFGTTTATIAFGTTPTVGNTLFCGIVWASTTAVATVSSISDTAGNTYLFGGYANDTAGTNGGQLFIYYASNCKTHATNTISVTMSVGTNTGENFSTLYCWEAMGLLFPVQSATVSANGTTGSPSVSVTKISGGHYVFALAGTATGNITTAGTGYNIITTEGDTGSAAEYGLIAAGSSSSTCAFSSTFTTWNILAVPFSSDGTAGDPSTSGGMFAI